MSDQQKPVEDAEIVAIERSLDPLGITRVDARTVRKLLDALSDSKREIGEAVAKRDDMKQSADCVDGQYEAALDVCERLQTQLLTVTNELEGERKRLRDALIRQRDALYTIRDRQHGNVSEKDLNYGIYLIDDVLREVAGEAPADTPEKSEEVGGHRYVSTYCFHGNHDDCRLFCKTCEAPCECSCGHPKAWCPIHHYRHGRCKPDDSAAALGDTTTGQVQQVDLPKV